MNELQLLATYLTTKLNTIIGAVNNKTTLNDALLSIRNGVASDGDDLNKLRALIAALQATDLSEILSISNTTNGNDISLTDDDKFIISSDGSYLGSEVVNANRIIVLQIMSELLIRASFDILRIANSSSKEAQLNFANLTDNRIVLFQDKDIVVAGLDDITTAIADLVDTSPATLDTLNELAAALGNDPNFATTVTNAIATKLPLSGGTMTGDIELGTNFLKSNSQFGLLLFSTVGKFLMTDGSGTNEVKFDISQNNATLEIQMPSNNGKLALVSDITNKTIIGVNNAMYAVQPTNEMIVLKPGASIIEMMDINQPPPINIIGMQFTIKNLSGTTCVIQNQFGQLFDEQPTISINHLESYTIMATPSFNWIII